MDCPRAKVGHSRGGFTGLGPGSQANYLLDPLEAVNGKALGLSVPDPERSTSPKLAWLESSERQQQTYFLQKYSVSVSSEVGPTISHSGHGPTSRQIYGL